MSTETTAVWSATAGDPAHPLVVLSHGSMDRSAGMLRLSRRLAADHFVVRYDRRGYGRSSGVGPPYRIEHHVADLASLVEKHTSGGSADLVFGHSFGGNIALALAGRRPDVVRRVVVYETPLSWLDWWPGSGAGGAALAAEDPADAAEAFMRRLVGDKVWERVPAPTRASRRAEGAAMIAELTDLRRAAPWRERDIGVPVLAVCGEHAKSHHRRGMRAVADLIPGGRFAELAGAGHGAPNTHATELGDLLRAFVSDAG